jgi:hypothetical protein
VSAATKAPKQNGAAVEAVELDLPVDTFKDAALFLRRPFTQQAVKFKVQATWDGGALIVPYIDARLAIERLNAVCPHLWTDKYEPTNTGLMWCHLTVDGITRSDVGTEIGKGDAGKKGLVSDAFKRAAVKFGIGVSLYAMPKLRVKESDGHLASDSNDKYKLTPNGESRCRSLYAGWLDTTGIQAFGKPLNHGDADDSVGDAEVEQLAGTSPAKAEAKRRNGQGDGKSSQATAAQRRKIHALASGLGLTEPQLKAWIEWNAGTPHTDRIEKAAASKLIEMLEAYEDVGEALSAFNAALEAEDEKAQKIAAKYSGGGTG